MSIELYRKMGPLAHGSVGVSCPQWERLLSTSWTQLRRPTPAPSATLHRPTLAKVLVYTRLPALGFRSVFRPYGNRCQTCDGWCACRTWLRRGDYPKIFPTLDPTDRRLWRFELSARVPICRVQIELRLVIPLDLQGVQMHKWGRRKM